MKYIYLLIATIAFASCTSDIITDGGRIPVEIVVEATSFEEKVQDVSTRASVNAGITTTFVAGDDLGIFVVDAGGNIIVDNLKYVITKTGHAYPVDDDGNIIASKIYYDPSNKIFAYAPYDAEYDGCKSVTEITDRYKSLYGTKYADQSTIDKYNAADLLVCSSPTWTSPRLKLTFSHAMSLLKIFYNGDYTELTVDEPATLSKMYKRDGTSTYRYIMPPKDEMIVYGTAVPETTGGEGTDPTHAYSFWQIKVDMKENHSTYVTISSQPTESYKTAGVDMGFPSGCIWAAYNLGSESKEQQESRVGKWYDADGNLRTDLMDSPLHKSFDRGDYYSWAELYTKYEKPAMLFNEDGSVKAVGDGLTTNSSGVTSTTPLVQGSKKGYYPETYIDRTYSYAQIDGTIAGTEHDVVRKELWKGEWRIPNENEVDELMRNCDISVEDFYFEDNVRYASWIAEKDAEGKYVNLHANNSEFYGTDNVRPYRYLVTIFKFTSKINGEVLYIPGGTWSDWSIDQLACRSRNHEGKYSSTAYSSDYGGMYYFASSASHSQIDCASYMEMETELTKDETGKITGVKPVIKYSSYKDKNGNTVNLMGLTQNGHRYTGMLIRPVYGGKNWNTNPETRSTIRINVE
ncbi:MAG: fimbrillin family protein [Prevotella sp.]|nr:fimbrillin family protein [Prevotella sp.]